jgi:hypothetical protein
MILASIVWIIHLILIIGVIIAPFSKNMDLKRNALIFLLYLLFQYLTGYQKCGLTELEYFFMGKEYESGFLYRLINPLIKIPENYFNYWFYVIHIILIGVLCYQLFIVVPNNVQSEKKV